MLLLAIAQRAFASAESYAARALNAYPVHHDRVPALAHDIALLCVREGVFTIAHSLLRRVVDLITRPQERVIVWSTYSLAAAGCGRTELYERGRESVLTSIARFPTSAPPALMNLAFAARLLGDAAGAVDLAHDALEQAEGNPLFSEQAADARELLASAGTATALSRPEARPNALESAERLRALELGVSRVLARWHGPTWRPGKQQTKAGDFGRV
jgi:hypothetical protein